jgi:hypothetical protein
VGQIGCAPVPLEAQVRRGLTAHTSPASPPELQPMPVTPAKNATPFSNLQEGLEEPVEEMVSAHLMTFLSNHSINLFSHKYLLLIKLWVRKKQYF